ncbi:ABC transporter permease [Frankia tisae]|uniref:ABC transporter permease n=1 Tax=Frankia tisae TaxID=2950104 RepID=UPI0021C0211D|nr:ABC transporter permease [Frankia tisae]
MARLDPLYVVRRTLQAALVIVLSYVLVFSILYVLPGNPIESRIDNPDSPLPPAEGKQLLAYYGLDKTLFHQFITYTGRILHGDFGYSLASGLPVREQVFGAFPSTLLLASLALGISLVLSSLLAVIGVFAPWEAVRTLFQTVPGFFMSVPTFVSGLLFIEIFSFQLGWFSSIRNEGLRSLIFPAVTLALAVCAPIAQVLIQGLQRAAKQPFVSLLRAQGNSTKRIVSVNVFKNGAIPAITLFGLTAAELLAGSVVVEIIYGRRGIGYVAEQAVTYQDGPVVMAIALLISVIYTVLNLATDLLYPFIDPRIDRASARTSTTSAPRRPGLLGLVTRRSA